MGNIFFIKEDKIEIFFTDYLNNFNFQHTDFKKRKYFLPLTNHFDFFYKIIFRILKKEENKQKINLICNGFYILSANADFILHNNLEKDLIEIVKNLNINKISTSKNLVLFLGVIFAKINEYEIIHNCDFDEFKNDFKKVIKDLEVERQLKNINSWSPFYFSWSNFLGKDYANAILDNPQKWFLSLI